MRDLPTIPRYTSANAKADRKLKPAGEHFGHPLMSDEHTRGHTEIDRETGAPARPCANCGNRFRPTQRRRMLCRYCFTHTN